MRTSGVVKSSSSSGWLGKGGNVPSAGWQVTLWHVSSRGVKAGNNLSTLRLVCFALLRIRHETVSGYYRTSAYFLAKLVCDVMPQRVFPIVLFAVITYFMIGTSLLWFFVEIVFSVQVV